MGNDLEAAGDKGKAGARARFIISGSRPRAYQDIQRVRLQACQSPSLAATGDEDVMVTALGCPLLKNLLHFAVVENKKAQAMVLMPSLAYGKNLITEWTGILFTEQCHDQPTTG